MLVRKKLMFLIDNYCVVGTLTERGERIFILKLNQLLDKQANIYRILRTLMEELDCTAFKNGSCNIPYAQ